MIDIYDIEQIIKLHDRIISETGGIKGIIDKYLLETAISKPFMGLSNGTEFYPDVFEKSAILLEALINYHPFIDGNKRTAVVITTIFLWNNGYIWNFDEDEIVEFAVDVAIKKLDINNIKDWIKVRIKKYIKSIGS